MATYFFSSLTTAQAQTFSADTDSIIFNTSESGADFRATINTTLGTYHVTTTTGRDLDFGPGLLGASFTLSDGSVAKIGTSQGDNLNGTTGNDGLFGADGADILVGGDGNDVLDGGGGADQLFGGAGANRFIFEPGHSLPAAPDIVDWNPADVVEFTGLSARSGKYEEFTAGSAGDAASLAEREISAGHADYVAVAVGGNVLLFAGDRLDGHADDMVQINGVGLAGISASNVAGATDVTPPPPPPPPPVGDPLTEPTLPQYGIGADYAHNDGTISGNMDTAHIGHLLGATITFAGFFDLDLEGRGVSLQLGGSSLTYDANQQLVGGFASNITFDDASGPFHAFINLGGGISAAPFGGWVQTDATQLAFSTLLAGNNQLLGSAGADLIRGYAGADLISGGGGSDTIFGGDGSDIILENAPGQPIGSTYLRGEDGFDYIVGGAGFDDINGNQGNDTLAGGPGDDWVVGGKDNDLQFGDDGNDVVWGNLGNDTLEGGAGADQIRGGQGDDVLWGDAGNDYISGDRGNDTETGGAGADRFHSFSGAGIDRVLDFNYAEGDRVMLDPGTAYTLKQAGADTIVDMGNGDEVILVGVSLTSLPGDFIFLSF